ncbi:MAG: YbaK/EbsC family protein [Candidatus Nanohaloarchaea archaeon]
MVQSFNQTFEELESFLEMFEEDLDNIRRVKDFCQKNKIEVKFEIHPKAETVNESVKQTPINKNQIIKTLVFKTGKSFIAVLAPGDKEVDTDKIKAITGEDNVRMANPEEVEKETGYIVGGVSPFDLDLPVFMEENLLEHDRVRPAAGSRVVGVEVEPQELADKIGARRKIVMQ